MKSSAQKIVMRTQELMSTYGKEKVNLGLQTALAFHYAYDGDFKISFWKNYILISTPDCANVLEDAELVFDLEAGQTIVDRRGLTEQGLAESLLEAMV